jgi:putative FmdB family regulatory protein
MPLYEYSCPACGTFEASHPMAEAARPQACPACARLAGRILSAGHVGDGRSGGRGRRRTAREPRLVRRAERPDVPAPTRTHAHATRPWMLGH